LLSDKFKATLLPLNVRNYRNVRLRYLRVVRAGKSKVLEFCDQIVREMIANLQRHYGDTIGSRSVLFVCHKVHAATVRKWAEYAGFKQYDVGHWNALDGSNQWHEYDTVVVLSNPFRDQSHALNVYQAIFGPQSQAWLNAAPSSELR